jgi:hypothetical protein
VHVVYNTEAQNISVAQIQSQIDVLNEDFMRLNSDANDNCPQAANPYMQFQLARFDPEGQPTSGITRTYTDSLDFGNQLSIKRENTGGKTPWDATSYLNLYSGNIRTFIGYTTFPDADDSYDGAVLDYTVFGRGDEFSLLPQYNQGRTGTHEIGHWLRLSHTWEMAVVT